jgi:hypothetical protein
MQLERQKGISKAKNATLKLKWQLESQNGSSKAKKATRKPKRQLKRQNGNSKAKKATRNQKRQTDRGKVKAKGKMSPRRLVKAKKNNTMYMAENHLLQKLFSAGKLYFLLDDVPLKFDAKKLSILQFISLCSTDFCSFYSCRLSFHREGMLNLLIISWYTFLFNGHVLM